jgi:hypothetical protein
LATEIVRSTPEHGAALRRFTEEVWERPRSDAYFAWRYEDSARFHDVWLAMREGRCLAIEAVIRRPWRVGAEIVEIGEVFDWYALPEYRNAGLGVRIMQALMKEPYPLLLVGGSPDTQGLLPRLKWQIVASTERYVLPLGTADLAPALAQRLRLPMPVAELAARAALARPGQRPRRRRAPLDGRAIAVAGVGEELAELYRRSSRYRTVPQWPPALLHWLTAGFPAIGHFVPLYFARGDELIGWLLLRIHARAQGCDAEIIECFAPDPDPALYTWMVSEAATLAAAFAPEKLGAQTTCPMLAKALRNNRFVRTRVNPVQLWWPGRDGMPGPWAIGSNTNDSAIASLPARWWSDPMPR